MAAGDEQPSGTVASSLRVISTSLPPGSVENAIDVLAPIGAVWTGPDETNLVTSGVTERLTASGEERFREIRRAAEHLFDRLRVEDVPFPARPRLLGGFSFFGSRRLQPPWEGFPPAMFALPEWQLAIEGENAWLTVVRPEPAGRDEDVSTEIEQIRAAITASENENRPLPGIRRTRPLVDEDTWKNDVESLRESIRQGTLRKAVLSQALDVTLERPFDLRPVYEALTATYPNCFRFAFAGRESTTGDDTATFFGASPEPLVSKTGTEIETAALAGTIGRGEDSQADSELAARMRADPKIREEHGVVIEHLDRRLSSIGRGVSVADRGIRRLENVQHLQSLISATVDEGTHVLDVVEHLHPTPAVGGVPPRAAIEAIEDLEPLDRGWYAAPVGWFDEAGDGTFAVGIRSAVAQGRQATVFAGNGIVGESDPEDEFAEVQLKFRPILEHIQ
jgi:menaquinone-specific isochorismate synthase